MARTAQTAAAGTPPRPFPFRAVIFDMDGVLVDTEAHYWRELRAFSDAFGLGVSDDELNRQVGQSHELFRKMLAGWLRRAGAAAADPASAEAIFEGWARDRPCDYASLMNPGVPGTLERLARRGVRLALASSSKMSNIEQVLGACGIRGAFEAVVSGEQFRASKPDPEIYLHALGVLGLEAGECCCVEDSVPGILAGARAGLTVVAKREDRFGFSQDGADIIIDEIPDLLDLRGPGGGAAARAGEGA